MAADGVKFQVNFKTNNGTLINVYADSVVDGIATMNEMAAAVDLIQTIEHKLLGAGRPLGGVPDEGVSGTVPPWARGEAAPQAPAPTSQTGSGSTSDGGRTCRHGAMVHRSGNGAKGPWQGFFCPTPKGTPDQCPPQFVR